MELSNLPPIIGLAGKIRSGKSTTARILAEKYGYTNAPNVRVLKAILDALELPSSRKLLALTGDTIFADLGRDIIARARVGQIRKSNPEENLRFVVDGIRYTEELDVYYSLKGFKLISIKADDNTRYQRAISDHDKIKDGSPSLNEFLSLNDKQSEQYVEKIMSSADYALTNQNTTSEYEASIDQMIGSFQSGRIK